MRILLLCDHKWRDLPGLSYLKFLLQENFKHTVVNAPIIYWDDYISGFRPHLVVLNHLNGPRNRGIAKRAKDSGMAVCVVPTEGFPNHLEHARLVAGKFTDLSNVDLYFVWNEVMRKIMIDEQTLPAEKIVVSGVPRFDFYAPPLHKIISTKERFCEDYHLNPDVPLVTWATNFPFAKFADWKQDILRQELKDMGYLNFKSFPGADSAAQQQKQSRIYALEVMNRVIKKLPNVNFAIKPHPAEDISIYNEFIYQAGRDHVVLVLGRYIWDVVNACDLHLHHRCVTAAEAWLCGKPTIDLKLTDGDYWFTEEIAKGNDLVTDEKPLFDCIGHYLNGGEIPLQYIKARESFIPKWFYRIDGHRTMKCAESINTFLEVNNPRPDFLRMSDIRIAARLAVRHAFSIPYHNSVRFWTRKKENGNLIDFYGQRDKTIQPEDVKTWIQHVKNSNLVHTR